MIFDIHAHIFPQKIAQRAAVNIGKFYNMDDMRHAGSTEELLSAMQSGGIDRALVHSVAMSSTQPAIINDFITSQVNAHPDKLVGFATLHPDMAAPGEELERALNMGLKGVKIHSDMQQVALTDPRMDAIYDACQQMNCPMLLHMGDSRYHYDNPAQVPQVLRRFPRLTLICAHMGGYTEWDAACEHLLKENVFVDTSSTYFAVGAQRWQQLVRAFGANRVLWGSDYPMWDPGEEKRLFESLDLTSSEREKIFYRNAESLLHL